MKAGNLLDGAVHTPETLKVIGRAFDDAWREIRHRFNGNTENARLELAHAVLAVAHEHGQGATDLKKAVASDGTFIPRQALGAVKAILPEAAVSSHSTDTPSCSEQK